MIATATPRTQTLVSLVIDAVSTLIRERGLRAGDELPSEAHFGEAVGVSRTVVREAFVALASMKLIDVANGRCARVGRVDATVMSLSMMHAVQTEQVGVQQIWDVRRTLESRTATLAALRRSTAEAAEITELARSMRQAYGNFEAQTEYDIAFHVAIARASRNPLFEILIESFKDVMVQTCPIGWRSRPTEAERLKVFDQHDAIAEGISDQDPEASKSAMAAHFDLSIRALTNAGYN
jgi:GntR family transcriptional regulator, transcriptional repressor for pyruvate dehydrogenase complex